MVPQKRTPLFPGKAYAIVGIFMLNRRHTFFHTGSVVAKTSIHITHLTESNVHASFPWLKRKLTNNHNLIKTNWIVILTFPTEGEAKTYFRFPKPMEKLSLSH
jgi:hypothetical protein